VALLETLAQGIELVLSAPLGQPEVTVMPTVPDLYITL